MKAFQIEKIDLDFCRERMSKPFGFKGAAFHEKWICDVSLTSSNGVSASGLGGLAVLWSDERVFLSHTETGGNILMMAVLEQALAEVKGQTVLSPPDFLDVLLPKVERIAIEITGLPELRRTFVLNALVALDAAAWRLLAKTNGISSFDTLMPAEFQSVLSHRHSEVEVIPLVSYEVSLDEIRHLVRSGHSILKVKIGASGSEAEMLEKDKRRLTGIHTALATPDLSRRAPLRYYLDANLRYSSLEAMRDLLNHAKALGMDILLLEEPFGETCDFPVHSLDVIVAADESLHSLEDVHKKASLGYQAIALKPAGKTLSKTLRMAVEAKKLGLHCFVADNACPPGLVDMNRNVAARLAPLPGLKCGLMEINGPQSYRDWDRLIASHPSGKASWNTIQEGRNVLHDSFYRQSGGWLHSFSANGQ